MHAILGAEASEEGRVIQVHFDIPALHGILSDVAQEQIPYATSRALNDTALAGQEDQRQGMRGRFRIKRPDFLDRSVKVPRFTTKRDSELKISIIIDPNPNNRGPLWDKFEPGGTKTPTHGQSIAVPMAIARGGIVPDGMRPKQLNLHTSGRRVIGDQRTFLLEYNGKRGIFQRTGRKQGDIRLLYWLTPSVPIPPSLEFGKTLTPEMLQELFALNFEARFAEAMRTAKPRGSSGSPLADNRFAF